MCDKTHTTLKQIFDVNTGSLLHTLVGHTDSVKSANFSPSGTRIVTAADDTTAKVWNTETGDLLHTLTGHTNWTISANLSPDARVVVTISRDRTAKIWKTLYQFLIVFLNRT